MALQPRTLRCVANRTYGGRGSCTEGSPGQVEAESGRQICFKLLLSRFNLQAEITINLRLTVTVTSGSG